MPFMHYNYKQVNFLKIILTARNREASWKPMMCQNSFWIFWSVFKQLRLQIVQRSNPLTTPAKKSTANKKKTFLRNLLISLTAWYCHRVSFTFPINSPFGPWYAIKKAHMYSNGTIVSILSFKTRPRRSSCAKVKKIKLNYWYGW